MQRTGKNWQKVIEVERRRETGRQQREVQNQREGDLAGLGKMIEQAEGLTTINIKDLTEFVKDVDYSQGGQRCAMCLLFV